MKKIKHGALLAALVRRALFVALERLSCPACGSHLRFRARPAPCVLCGRTAPNGYLCRRHMRQRWDDKRRARKRAYSRGAYRCGRCGSSGHNARTCPVTGSS